MKLLSLLFAFVLLPHFTASALSISISAGILLDEAGNPMTSGVVVLTAATTGTFTGPYGHNFTDPSGDERAIAIWDFSAGGSDGAFSGFADNLSFGDGWDAGDPLRLYWYPNLPIGQTPSAGMVYGTYSGYDPANPGGPGGSDGSAPWVTPEDTGELSDYYSLSFLTSDAGGSNDPGAGSASFFVPPTAANNVPDSGGTLLFLSASFAGIVAIRRFQGRAGRPVPGYRNCQ